MYETKRSLWRPAILVLILLTFILAACGGQIANGNWPGITVSGKNVYVAFGPGLITVDAANCSQNWSFPAEFGQSPLYYAAPAVNETQVIVGDYGTSGGLFSSGPRITITALQPAETNSTSPTVLWSRDDLAKDRIIAPPLLTDSQVFIGTADNQLFALDATTGQEQWRFETGHSIWGQPAYRDGVVYLTSLDNKVYALNAETGAIRWEKELSGAIAARPVLDGNLLFVASFDNKVHALSLETGDEVWAATAENWVWAAPAVTEEVIYYADIDGNVYAAETSSGRVLWSQKVLGAVQTTPAYANGNLYVVSGDVSGDTELRRGHLTALNGEDGNQLWQQETSVPLFTDPVIVNETVVVVTQGAGPLLYVYNLESGSQLCQFTLDSGE